MRTSAIRVLASGEALIALGMSNAEIAGEQFVSETTVKTPVSHILAKLDLWDRMQAVDAFYEATPVTPALDEYLADRDHCRGRRAARSVRMI